MQCPHCKEEIKPRGPDCPKCRKRLFGSGGTLDVQGGTPATVDADDSIPATPSQRSAPKAAEPDVDVELVVDRVEDISVDDGGAVDLDAAFDTAVAETGVAAAASGTEAAAVAGTPGYAAVDLDADAQAEETGEARRGELQESLATEDQIRERRDADFRETATESAYDESLMGGLYIGALVGGLIGYLLCSGQDKLWLSIVGAIGGAILAACIGLGIGLALGKGTAAGLQTAKGQSAMMGIGLVIAAGPLVGVLIFVALWGFGNHLFFAVCTYAVMAFAFFAYVWQDATRRQGDSAVGWGLLVGALPPLLGLYFSRRPHGEIRQCGGVQCEQWHLATLPRCPHCGYEHQAGRTDREVDLG
jgi:hypothetical protein